MTRISVKSLGLITWSPVPILAILAYLCAASTGAEQQMQSRHEFAAVLIDAASKKPVPSARIILAPKKEGKLECTIDTSLTGISNESGEVRIPNVGPGEYVVFYNLSASLYPGLNGKVVNYDTAHSSSGRVANTDAISGSFRFLEVLKGAVVGNDQHGRLALLSGYIFSSDFDLAMIMSKGELLKVCIHGSESAPIKIEIITDLPKPSPPRGTPKSGP